VTAPSRPDSFVRAVALFDLDRTDANNDPLIIGKPDIHLTGDGANGTFLLWGDAVAGVPPDQVHALW
jgi:hypothetical protein